MAALGLFLFSVVLLWSGVPAENSDPSLTSSAKEDLASTIDAMVTKHMENMAAEFRVKFSELESENRRLKSGVIALESGTLLLQSTIASLERDNLFLLSKVDVLEREHDLMKKEFELFKVQIDNSGTSSDGSFLPEPITPVIDQGGITLDGDPREITPVIDPGEITLGGDPRDITPSGDQPERVPVHLPPRRRSRDTRPQVAFQAKLDHKLSNLPSGHVMRFRVDLNIGQEYNPQNGVFSCEVPGLYVFHTTITLYTGNYLQLYFKKNGHTFGQLFVADKDFYASGSTTVLVHLQTGDRVWLEADQAHTTGDVVDPGWSYMSGFLLYSDHD